MGKAAHIEQPTVTNQQINAIEIDPRTADTLFVYYSMLTRRQEFFTLGAGGSRTPILNKSQFEQLHFVLPPLAEQRAIARILGALDDKIELNRRTNETLEGMARALFQSWFVDFDPVRAKMEGRQPEGMDAETAKLVPVEELTRSGVLAIGDGYRAKNDELGAQGICFARAADVIGGEVAKTVDHLLPERVVLAKDKVARVGDVVFTSKGTVGRFALVRGGRPFVYSPQLCYWRSLDTEVLPPLYLFHWMQSSEFVRQINMVKGQTDMADYVSLRDQRAMRVRVPDLQLANRFASATKPLDTQVEVLRRQSEALTALRDTLLPKLLSGELRVPDAERAVSEVL
jgi:type I restriction enzyme S subunit